MRRLSRCTVGALSSSLFIAASIWADDPPAPPPESAASTEETVSTRAGEEVAFDSGAPVRSKGILPIPNYGGDIWSRSYFTGDWGGLRSNLADKGFQLELNWTNTLQSVVSGGLDHNAEIGGALDVAMNFDLDRMGLVPGALVKFRGQSRYGNSVNNDTGVLLPVNTIGFVPLTSPPGDEIPFAIEDLTYYQFLSEHFGAYVGKIDTFDGDPNEFASGRGIRQFMNLNFIFSPVSLLSVPYSTLAAGIMIIPIPEITITSSVMNTTDASTTSGFGDFGEGTTWATEADFQYRLGSLPGGQNLGFVFAFDNAYKNVGERFIFSPGEGFSVPTSGSTWAIYWSAWQYLYTPDAAPGLINVRDGRPDLRGIGLFSRIGFADQNTNPFKFAASVGLGGRGLIPSRDNDTIGLGYYYNALQSDRIISAPGAGDSNQGLEAFYGLAITPAANLTFDLQWAKSNIGGIDDALIVGARLNLSF